MKSIILVVLALVAVAVALPVEEVVPILSYKFDQAPEGNYEFGFTSGNGIARSESGVVKEVLDEENKPHNVVVVRGSYSFVNPDGESETITYVADEEGYRADGKSIPKPARR